MYTTIFKHGLCSKLVFMPVMSRIGKTVEGIHLTNTHMWQRTYRFLTGLRHSAQSGNQGYAFSERRVVVLLLLLFYAIVTVFHLHRGRVLMSAMRKRYSVPTPLLIQGIFNHPYHICMVREVMPFDETARYILLSMCGGQTARARASDSGVRGIQPMAESNQDL